MGNTMRRTCPPGTRISSVRRSRFHSTPAVRYAYKDDQDKDSLNPRSTEYSKSGSDNEAAQTDEAFDPSTTSPEGQQSKQEMKGGTENPLEMSPANQQSSKARDPNEGGAINAPDESQSDRARTSSTGSGKKAGGGKSG